MDFKSKKEIKDSCRLYEEDKRFFLKWIKKSR